MIISHDLDYAAALLHGRRSQMAEAQRLEALCRLRNVAELSLALYPGTSGLSIITLQQRLVEDPARELRQLVDYLPGPGAAMLDWLVVRFEVENLKILVRKLTTHQPLDEHLLVQIPGPSAIDAAVLCSANSLQELIQRLPEGPFRTALKTSAGQSSFFVEATLDRAYFSQLLQRLDQLGNDDREVAAPVIIQEVDLWQAMLALRAKFTFGLSTDLLLPLRIEGTRLSRSIFADMVRAQEVSVAAGRAVGCALDTLPSTPDLGVLEIAGWKRFFRLANQAFRRGPIGLGAIIGYAGLRRVEVTNLITISEGIRAAMDADRLRARLIT